jgi:hypothetical protein
MMCAAVAFAILNLHSTTVLAPRFEMLVDRAEMIFTGQVASQRSEWRETNGRKCIVTLVTFAVQQVHKGRAEASVTLQFLGGTIGDVTLDVAEMPSFKEGERVVLFVASNGRAVSPVIGFFHGKFLLRKEGDRDVVLKHNGEPLVGSPPPAGGKKLFGAAGTVADSSHAVSHEEFSARIRQRLTASKP